MSLDWVAMPKISPAAQTCVRWNTQRRVYELVLDGVVRASASRLKMSLRGERLKFHSQVRAALEEKRLALQAEKLRVLRGE